MFRIFRLGFPLAIHEITMPSISHQLVCPQAVIQYKAHIMGCCREASWNIHNLHTSCAQLGADFIGRLAFFVFFGKSSGVGLVSNGSP